MPRKRSTRRGRDSGTAASYWPWLAGGLIMAAVAFLMLNRPTPVDPKTACPEVPLGLTAIVIDVSDRLDFSQEASLRSSLQSLSSTSPERPVALLEKGERLVVYFVEPEGRRPKPFFSMCHPGDVDKRTARERLSEGEIFAQKRWERFSKEVVSSIKSRVDTSGVSPTSPIIETLRFVRSKEFPSADLIGGHANYRLIIWSDMLQNSREESHFQGLGDYRQVLKRNPVLLDGIETQVFQLASSRYSKYQTGEHRAWWRKFFALARADMNSWEVK